jgi:hypothetical protein
MQMEPEHISHIQNLSMGWVCGYIVLSTAPRLTGMAILDAILERERDPSECFPQPKMPRHQYPAGETAAA